MAVALARWETRGIRTERATLGMAASCRTASMPFTARRAASRVRAVAFHHLHVGRDRAQVLAACPE